MGAARGIAIGLAGLVTGLSFALVSPAGASGHAPGGPVKASATAKVAKRTAVVKVHRSGQVVAVPKGTRKVKVKIRPKSGVVITSLGRRAVIDREGCLFLDYREAYGFKGDVSPGSPSGGDGEYFCAT